MDIKKAIDLNLERLKRQYIICIEKYDEPALLDLSHILRIWVDMQQPVQSYINTNLILCKFKAYSIKTRKDIPWKDNQYITTYFPDGVAVREEENGDGLYAWEEDVPMGSILVNFTAAGKGKYAFNEVFHMLSADIDKKILLDMAKNAGGTGMYSTRKVSFTEWLKSETIRVNYIDQKTSELTRRIIPREILIKRVANVLGGSHPEDNDATFNIFDNSIKFLMKLSISCRPLPYYILIKFAHDILTNFGAIDRK